MVKVHVIYCGAWGYASKFRSFERDLRGKLSVLAPNVSLEVSGEKTPGATGKFEVFVDGKLVHSKKEHGQGFVDSESKLQAIIDAILQ